MARATLRIWELDDNTWRLMAGPPAEAPRAPRGSPQDSTAWLALNNSPGLFLEVTPVSGGASEDVAHHVATVIEALLESVRGIATLTTEVAARYQEIDLLYTIGELLGRAHPVDEIASVILREVTAVVGARRAALRVFDEEERVLRSVATVGTEIGAIPTDVSVDEPDVVVARAF